MIILFRVPFRLGPSTLLPAVHLCVLLLILVFTLVSPMTGGPYLPKAATGLAVGKSPATVSVDERGAFFILERAGWKPVPDAELAARVRALVHSRSGTPRLYVTADRDVSYDRVLVLADAAREAGVRQLDLATDCPRHRDSLLRSCRP